MDKNTANKQFNSGHSEAQKWFPAWQDLKTYINQTRGRFDDDQYNRGKMIDHKTILDGYATYAQKSLASGLLSGMTSPNRPWFRLTVDERIQQQIPSIRLWLDQVQEILFDILNKSNLYQIFYGSYEEIGQFGTACFAVLEDYEDVVRGRSFTSGEYWLGADNKGRVNKFGREYWFQASQLATEFGMESLSSKVITDIQTNQGNGWFKCRHMIVPNMGRDDDKKDFTGKKFSSLYWESADGGDKFLAKRGYDYFPIIAPRWDTVTTDNVYGYGPSWFALGDGKQLQKTNLDKLIAQEKIHTPPLQSDASVDGFVHNVAGGVTKTNSNVPNSGVRAAYEINPNLESFIEMENSLKSRIDKFFFVDLFRMISSLDGSDRTATEIAERQSEKIMMMGPVLHRLTEEKLDPVVGLLYNYADDAGVLPEPPQEAEGLAIKVQYISILAQAQKALGVNAIDKVIGFVLTTAPINPDVVHEVNWSETVREISELEGAPNKILNSPETVQAIKENIAQQQQMAQMAELAESGSKSVKNVADAGSKVAV